MTSRPSSSVGFVNHQFQDLLSSKDRETRHRHANAIKQLSPPRDRKETIGAQNQTAYEKWWYEQRDKMIQQLESDEEPQQQQQQQQSRSTNGNSNNTNISKNNRGVSQEQQQQQSSVPRGNSNNNGASEISPVRHSPEAQNNTNNNVTQHRSSNSRSNSHSNSHSPSSRPPSRIPGTEFEPLHPSHLYLHHHDVPNHYFEDLVRHPENKEQVRELEQEAKRSPSRHGPNLTSYEQWWYSERDRILNYVHQHTQKQDL